MRTWGKWLRGAVGVGLAWAGAWFGAGMILLAIVGLDAADVPFPLFFGFLGFIAGVAFSGILALVERHRRFDQMSVPRFAGWGAVGGMALSGVMALISGSVGDFLGLTAVFGLAGAVSAGGSLALARRGTERALPASVDEELADDPPA